MGSAALAWALGWMGHGWSQTSCPRGGLPAIRQQRLEVAFLAFTPSLLAPSLAVPPALQDVGSGLGGVHNAYLYDHPQKQVVRSPFVGSIQPMPPHVQSLPLGVAKVVAGLAHSGLRGVLRMLLWAK